MNPWSVNRILQLYVEVLLQSSNTTGNSDVTLLDKYVILDILDNDFAVSSNKILSFHMSVLFTVENTKKVVMVFYFYFSNISTPWSIFNVVIIPVILQIREISLLWYVNGSIKVFWVSSSKTQGQQNIYSYHICEFLQLYNLFHIVTRKS